MGELLDATGARVAALCGCAGGARGPGRVGGDRADAWARASRAGTGRIGEALPRVDAVVLMQRGHEYKYARCATLAGARVEWVDDIAAALARGGACRGAAPGAPRRRGAAAVGSSLRSRGRRACRWSSTRPSSASRCPSWNAGRRAGDVACFSAKYFCGPNAGGFVAGAAGPVADVAALDFTGYESRRVADVRARVQARPVDGRGHASPPWRSGWRSITTARLAGLRGAGRRCWRSVCGALPGARVELRTVHLDERLVRRAGQRRAACAAASDGAGARLAARRAQRARDGRRRRARVLHRGR